LTISTHQRKLTTLPDEYETIQRLFSVMRIIAPSALMNKSPLLGGGHRRGYIISLCELKFYEYIVQLPYSPILHDGAYFHYYTIVKHRHTLYKQTKTGLEMYHILSGDLLPSSHKVPIQ